MSNTSKKRRNKKIRIGVIIGLIVVLIGSFFISKKSSEIDPTLYESIEVTEPTKHIKGNLESEIVLIEYSDFQCPACKNTAPQLSQLIEQFGDQFQLEYRHFPLRSIHPNAQIAAQAAEAAGMQGKFWEMHDILFENQSEWGQSFNPTRLFRKYAEEIGINPDRLEYDLESDLIEQIVDTHYGEAEVMQLPGTPSFVFDGEIINLQDFISEYILPEPIQ